MKPSEYLKDHWWHREYKGDDECIATVVTSSEAATNIGYTIWREALLSILGFDGGSEIFDWNDSPERTLEEVLAVAREAENLVLGNTK